MTDENVLRISLNEAWDAIHVLTDQIDDLVLRQSATEAALVKALPAFAKEYLEI